MEEGPNGSTDKSVKLVLPADAQRMFLGSSFQVYRSEKEHRIIVYQSDYHAINLHLQAADLERLITRRDEGELQLRESNEEIPQLGRPFARTPNWEMYVIGKEVLLKNGYYHAGVLSVSLQELSRLWEWCER